jgi:GntR family transcriptional repressor for pyruvate dehydrogenase complex
LEIEGIEKIKKSTLTEGVISRIKNMIEGHSFAAGEKLPAEREFAEMFGVGRSSVREALQVLQAVGALDRKQGKGTFLGDAAVQSLRRMDASSERYSFQELAEARRVIEVQAAALSAKNADDGDIKAMKASCLKHTEISRSRPRPEVTVLDYDFHRMVVRGAHNGFLLKMFDMLRDNLILSNYAVLTADKIIEAVNYHKQLLEAIESHDQNGAKRVMREHLTQVEKLIIRSGKDAANTREYREGIGEENK